MTLQLTPITDRAGGKPTKVLIVDAPPSATLGPSCVGGT